MRVPNWIPFRRGKKTGEETRPDVETTLKVRPMGAVTVPRELQLLRDGTVYSILNFLSELSLGSGWHFEGEDVTENQDILEAVTHADGFTEMLRALFWAMATRFCAIEQVWTTQPFWYPYRLRVLPPTATTLQIDENGDVQEIQVMTSAGTQSLPLSRAIYYRFRPTLEHPEGSSILETLQDDISFKRRADDTLVKNNERFGAPYIILRYPPGMSERQKQELLERGNLLQSASVAVIPEGVGVEIMEPSGKASAFALNSLSYLERRIARAVLGSILTMFESEYGTRAQAEVHFQVFKFIIASRQADIEDTVTSQLFERVLALNGRGMNCRFKLNEPQLMDRETTAKWVTNLTSVGIIDAEYDRDMVRRLFGISG